MLNLLNIFKNGLTLCLMLIIVGCASDGIKSGSYVSDGDTNSQYSNFTLYDPTSIRSFKIQTIGAKSANTYSTSVAGYGKAIVSLSRSDFVEDNNNCTSDGYVDQ